MTTPHQEFYLVTIKSNYAKGTRVASIFIGFIVGDEFFE
jgi:hypothetical protein